VCKNVLDKQKKKLMILKDNSKSFFSTVCKFIVCSICCPAHIEAISDFVPNILHQRTFSLCTRCSYSVLAAAQGYRLWWKVNIVFHKVSHAEVGRCQILGWRRTGSGNPRPRQMAQAIVQECSNIIVDMWWRSAMLGTCLPNSKDINICNVSW